jgi:hypothetical protein
MSISIIPPFRGQRWRAAAKLDHVIRRWGAQPGQPHNSKVATCTFTRSIRTSEETTGDKRLREISDAKVAGFPRSTFGGRDNGEIPLCGFAVALLWGDPPASGPDQR